MTNNFIQALAPMLWWLLLLIIVFIKIFSDHKWDGLRKTFFSLRVTERDKYWVWGRHFGAKSPESTWDDLNESDKTDILKHKNEIFNELKELSISDNESFLESLKILSPEMQKEFIEQKNGWIYPPGFQERN